LDSRPYAVQSTAPHAPRSARPTDAEGVRPTGAKRRPLSSSSIVAEPPRDAEILLAQLSHRFLKVVARRRRDAQLIALNRRLHFLQLGILQELHDIARLLGGNALLQGALLAHG